jgi:hypothetical protein
MKDIKNAIKHLREHQEFPATKEELIESCNNLADFSEEDKMWFQEHLPEGTYNSAEDVMKTLGVAEQTTQAM